MVEYSYGPGIDDDPALAWLREVALALPGATEKPFHSKPGFRTTTAFARFGAHVLGDTASDALARSVAFKADPDEREALLADPRLHRIAYMDRHGWLAYDLSGGDTDWLDLAELVETSYRLTAPKGLVGQLDQLRGEHPIPGAPAPSST